MTSLRSALGPLNLSFFSELEGFTHVPDESLLRQVSRALIMLHHPLVGGVVGPVGIPMGDLRPLGNGFTKPYSGGSIELLDFTDGPQGFHFFEASVRFVGFRCREQSESGPDEPYFIVGAMGANPNGNASKTFGPFEGVTTGSSTVVNQIISEHVQPPLTVSVVAMEHDSGSPSEASATVEKALNDASAKLTATLFVVGANPVIGVMVQSFVNIFGGWAADAASAVFGMGDDRIGENSRVIFDFDPEKMEWRQLEPRTATDFSEPFNVELDLDNGEGGRYAAFFQIELFSAPRQLIPPAKVP